MTCTSCLDYFEERGLVIARAIVDTAIERGLLDHISGMTAGFARGVHERHLAGLSIDVITERSSGPTMVVKHVGGCNKMCSGDRHYVIHEPVDPATVKPLGDGWKSIGYASEDGLS